MRKTVHVGKSYAGNPYAAALAIVAFSLAATVFGDSPRKKYIAFGWEFKRISPKVLLANADKFQATGIDGVGIYLCATNSAGKELMFVSRGDRWEKEAFRDQVPVLRQIAKTPHLSESFFVGFGAPLKRFAWTDDAAWANLEHSMSVLGWLTKETGIKGVSGDFEDYHHQWQFNRVDGDPEWDELVKIVRRRGAQIYGAMFRENPNLKALFYWILCFNTEYLTSPDPVAMARQNGDLQPAFFDGILDAMPETARLINGDEHTYRAEAVKRDFAYSLCNQRTVCPKLVSPENRAKFLRLTQVSFAIYSDMYANDEKAFWYFPPKGGSRAEHLRRNLLDATRLADEYIWFWGEKHPSIHWENAYVEPRVRCPDTWEEAIPGMTEALLCCKDPDWGLARRLTALKRGGKMVDRNPNPNCEGKGDRLPAPYSSWKSQADKDAGGSVYLDSSTGCKAAPSISMKGCKNSCALYIVKNCEPGESYAVMLASKGETRISIAFQKDNGWVRGMQGVSPLHGEPDAAGWRHWRGMVIVPPGCDSFVIKFGADRANDGKQVWFDDVHVVKLW